MGEDQAPSVVAVVVASDPGPSFEECLSALVGQDYERLSVLVIDAGSEQPLAARIAAVTPDAYVHRLARNSGFGPSANAALDIVDGAAYFLVCHDDVVPEPDAVRRMVEEAFRSNAGIVAPKLVAFDEPDRLLQLGLGVDRLGAPVRRVSRREFDQSQHDEAREVFGAPGGCTLVRADLFRVLGGYDPRITMFGEDVDLSWRARIAGARVVVSPSARVRHLEATASRQRPLPEARALQWRHELRAVLKNYSAARRVLVGAELAILSILEICYFGVAGKRWRVRQVVDAWRWNLAPEQDLRGARASVAASRRIPDRVVAKLFTRRSLRVTRFARPILEELAERWARPAADAERLERSAVRHGAVRSGAVRRHRRHLTRRETVAVAFMVLVILLGSRSVLAAQLPLVGQYLPLPGPATLLGHYLGGWTDGGLQHPGPATPAFAILGVLGLVLGGAMGIVLKVELVVAVVAGALGIARLLRPLSSTPGRIAAVAAYLFLPLAWNDVARGDLQGLAVYAGMPYVLDRLLRATGLAPFGQVDHVSSPAGGARAGRARRVVRESLGLGAVLAVVGSFAPAAVLLAVACGAALVVATAIFDRARAGARALCVALGGVAVAVVLTFPWSLTFFQPGARWSIVVGATPVGGPDLSSILRFALGPIGKGPLAWAFLAASAFVLLVGRGERFAWGARIWVVALAVLALAWVASEGWLGAGGGALRVLVAPVAVCVAALVGLGVASVASDLRSSGFGWRHVAAVAFGLAAVAGSLPVLGASLGGRWGVPAAGYDTVLSWLDGTGRGPSPGKVLWLGDPPAVPLPGWQIEPGLVAAISSRGLPDATRNWPSPDPGAARAVMADVVAAQSGLTVDLGAQLAPSGIHYVVVPSALAPVLLGDQAADPAPAPPALLDALTTQRDLHELPTEGGVAVFENLAWSPRRDGSSALAGGTTPAPLRLAGVVLALLAWVALAARYLRDRRKRLGWRHVPTPPGLAPASVDHDVAVAAAVETGAAPGLEQGAGGGRARVGPELDPAGART
jgi:GT2 family glycosyltransferase